MLDEPPIDVKVYVRHLAAELGERLRLGPDDVSLVGRTSGDVRFRIGDRVEAVVRDRDRERDRWVLGLSARRMD